MKTVAVTFACLATLAAACVSTPGAQPHDMSTAAHERMAAAEERSAAAHAAQYDPSLVAEKTRCGRGGELVGACWTSTVNPTAEHLKEAERHRKMAAEHRAASQVLRDAEARACGGISEQDRDMGPFTHREDIVSVTPLEVAAKAPKLSMTHLEGAVITFRAVPGMTAPWLQRLVDCHLARNAALGHEVPEMPYCPLVPKDVTATVTATSTGFAVAVQSKDPTVAREILRRASSLVSR